MLLEFFVYFTGFFAVYMFLGFTTRNKLDFSIGDYMFCVTMSSFFLLAARVAMMNFIPTLLLVWILPILFCRFIYLPFTRMKNSKLETRKT
jgi:hypothetical protein